jgi:hypothetical protein
LAKDLPVVLMGLDPGTSKNAVVIALVYKGSLELVGVGESPSVGIHKGVIDNPALSMKILNKKIASIEETGADIVATFCPTCVMQLRHGLAKHKGTIEVVHPVQLLAQSLILA